MNSGWAIAMFSSFREKESNRWFSDEVQDEGVQRPWG